MSGVLLSCSADDLNLKSTTETENVEKKEYYNLTSPNGYVLAKSTKELKEIITHNSHNTKNLKDIIITDVIYSESEKGSFAMVDYFDEGNSGSTLIPIFINKDYRIEMGKSDIYIVKKSKSKKNKLNTIPLKDLAPADNNDEIERLTDITFSCEGGCCSFSHVGKNHYHCGCESSPSKSIDITADEGCVIHFEY